MIGLIDPADSGQLSWGVLKFTQFQTTGCCGQSGQFRPSLSGMSIAAVGRLPSFFLTTDPAKSGRPAPANSSLTKTPAGNCSCQSGQIRPNEVVACLSTRLLEEVQR